MELHTTKRPRLSILLAVGGALALGTTGVAQTPGFRVVPAAYADLEGTSASRTPFGWATGRIQYLIDSAEICQSAALLTNFRLRLDGGNFNVDAPTGQVLQATIDAYEVPLTPATMTNDWSANIGGATGTQVFQGTLNVPAAARTYPYPNPWVVDVPLPTPFFHQRSSGNLMLDWQTSGGTGDNWPADAVFLHASDPRGETSKIWEDPLCSNARGDILRLSVPSTGNNGVIGIPLRVDHTGTPGATGAISSVYHNLGFDKRFAGGVPLPLDLGGLGYPNCQWNADVVVDQVVPGASGTAGWTVPFDPALVGVVAYAQAVGFDAAAATAVPAQNAWQIRIGLDTPAPGGPLQMLHRSNYAGQSDGFLSPTGYYGLVMGFGGVFQ